MYSMTVKGITKKYMNNLVLNNISLDFEKGKVYGLVGKNGVGKTTLLKIIVKLIPTKIYNEKVKIFDSSKMISALISNPSCYMNLSVKDNLNLYAIFYYKNKDERKKVIDKVVKDFKLESMLKKKAKDLSLGMLQKLKLSLTFISTSNILILDEPFNGLDIEASLILKEKIREEKNFGKTIIITSHNTEKLEKLCDDFAIFYDTNIISISKNELKENSLEEIYCNILERGDKFVS